MNARAYYNENDPFAAQWLRNLIADGLIAGGEVDERSIVDVRADDLRGFTQCHFFAGIGGWSYALRLAGWSDDRPVWTGSCPCQPFSVAGKKRGFEDERHLWPVWFGLIKQCRPAGVFGEQVAAATEWLRLVRSDLDALGYAVGVMPIEAASAGAAHLRDRFWFVGLDPSFGWREGRPEHEVRHRRSAAPRPSCGNVANAVSKRGRRGHGERQDAAHAHASSQENVIWLTGSDGKARPVKPGVRLLAHGIPNRIPKLRAIGNAIDPRPAAQFIIAATEALDHV